jgi:hypothetical protein
MTYLPQQDYDVEVSKGNVAGIGAARKFGRNQSVAQTTLEDMWVEGGILEWQTAAAKVDLVSSLAADTNTTGTGAWKIQLEGLDSNYAPISEELSLNGQNTVTSVNSYLRLQRMYITECGSSGWNEGDITAEWFGTATVAAKILATAGQTEQCLFTVPAGKTAQVRGLYTGIVDDASAGTRSVEMYIYIRLYNESSTNNYESWRRVHTVFLNQSGTTDVTIFPKASTLWPEKTDVRITVLSSKDGTNCFGRIEYHLLDA